MKRPVFRGYSDLDAFIDGLAWWTVMIAATVAMIVFL
jgi:hypothetical protein